MKTSYDGKVDALFVRFTDAAIAESEELSPDFIVDYDDAGHIVGIEILNAKQRLGDRFSPQGLAAA
jgi:uncharacterized protein YuzE